MSSHYDSAKHGNTHLFMVYLPREYIESKNTNMCNLNKIKVLL